MSKDKQIWPVTSLILVASMLASAGGQILSAQEPSNKNNPKASNQPLKQPNTKTALARPVITDAIKLELNSFVREHHPELERLLNWLEMNRPTQHQRAMQSLAVTYNRLNSLKQRDPEKYSLSIEHWKTKSRIQLVAAELALNDIPPLRGNLEKLVSEEVDLRTQLLTLDAKRFQARLDKLNAQVERLTGKREEEIERQVELAIRATNRLKPNRKAKARSNRKKKQDRKDSNKTSDKSSSKSKDDKS